MKKIKKVTVHARTRITARAKAIIQYCGDTCADFQIMESPLHANTLILRWLSIDISDIDRPSQCYQYECFEPDGTPMHCSIFYDTPAEEEAFYLSLQFIETITL